MSQILLHMADWGREGGYGCLFEVAHMLRGWPLNHDQGRELIRKWVLIQIQGNTVYILPTNNKVFIN